MVLISTFSASDRSALPSSSTLWKAPATMLLVPPTPALPPASSCNHTIKRKSHRTGSFSTQQAGSNGLLRAAGPGKAAARPSSGCEGAEGEKLIDFAALKSTV